MSVFPCQPPIQDAPHSTELSCLPRTPLGCGSFSDFVVDDLDIFFWEVLVRYTVGCLSIGVCLLDFSALDRGYRFLRGRPQSKKILPTSYGGCIRTRSTVCHCWCWPWARGWGRGCQVLPHCKVTLLYLPIPHCPVWKEVALHRPHHWGDGLCPSSLREWCLLWFFGILLQGKLGLLSCICSFTIQSCISLTVGSRMVHFIA